MGVDKTKLGQYLNLRFGLQLLALFTLAFSLTGNPGLTGPTPTAVFMSGGLLTMICSIYLWTGLELSLGIASLAVLALCKLADSSGK